MSFIASYITYISVNLDYAYVFFAFDLFDFLVFFQHAEKSRMSQTVTRTGYRRGMSLIFFCNN